jgi:photosystem II stability/assembly factor-like uncharacterized protein
MRAVRLSFWLAVVAGSVAACTSGSPGTVSSARQAVPHQHVTSAPLAGTPARSRAVQPRVTRTPKPTKSRSRAPGSLVPGKYGTGGFAFATPRSGLVEIGGYPGNSMVSHSWQERTSDGGQHWTAGRLRLGEGRVTEQGSLAFTSARQGWAFEPGLFSTIDAGRSWQAAKGAPVLVGSAAVSGGSIWLAGWQCTNAMCPSALYSVRRVGGPVTLLAAQPVTHGQIQTIVRLGQSRAAVLTGPHRGVSALAVTTDGGRQWTTRAVPCAPQEQVDLAGDGSGSLWLGCRLRSASMCGCDGRVVIYRSLDLGDTWVRMTTAHGTLSGFASLTPVSATQAWALTDDGPGQSTVVWRTVDGGHTWHQVLTGTAAHPLESRTLLASDATTAWIIDGADGGYTRQPIRVLRTTNSGHTWHAALLPQPHGL